MHFYPQYCLWKPVDAQKYLVEYKVLWDGISSIQVSKEYQSYISGNFVNGCSFCLIMGLSSSFSKPGLNRLPGLAVPRRMLHNFSSLESLRRIIIYFFTPEAGSHGEDHFIVLDIKPYSSIRSKKLLACRLYHYIFPLTPLALSSRTLSPYNYPEKRGENNNFPQKSLFLPGTENRYTALWCVTGNQIYYLFQSCDKNKQTKKKKNRQRQLIEP